jgi:hypothetical protein
MSNVTISYVKRHDFFAENWPFPSKAYVKRHEAYVKRHDFGFYSDLLHFDVSNYYQLRFKSLKSVTFDIRFIRSAYVKRHEAYVKRHDFGSTCG